MNQSTEIWKPVVGYEGYYEVSDRGRVRSLTRIQSHGRKLTGRIRALRSNREGYQIVHLSKDNVKQQHPVHALVLTAFVRARLPGEVCRHLDGNPPNNMLHNLTWGTQSENVADTVRHGTAHHNSKTHCPLGHVLEHPNLVIGQLKRGRKCLACNRARGYLHYRKLPFSKDVADEYYSDIMGS